MRFSDEFLEEVRTRLPVSEVVGRSVALKRRGREFVGLSPFQNEKTPSFTVNDEKGFYHCFSSGEHGDIFTFLMRVEGLSFPEAVERLAGEAGMELPRRDPEDKQRAEKAKSLHDACAAAQKWFEERLRGSEGKAALAYLRDRGLSEATIRHWHLGFAPAGRDGLIKALNAQGYKTDMLIEAGLVIQPPEGERQPYDRFRSRVIFPIADRQGRCIAFGGRILGDGQPKYLNSSESPIFSKGRTLYGLSEARVAAREDAPVLVTEGYMDVIALWQAGFKGAVAPLGTALTERHIEALWRLAPEPVLCFDGDRAGIGAGFRAAERALPLLKPGCSLRFAALPEGDDPDTLIAAYGASAMREVIDNARPLADMIWLMEASEAPADTPERRAGLEQRLMRRVGAIADQSVQNHYRDDLKNRLWRAFKGQRRGAGSRNSGYRSGHQGAPADTSGGGLARPPRHDLDATRREKLLLEVLVTHPFIVSEHAEEVVGLQFANGLHERVRDALLELVASEPDADRERAGQALEAAGLGQFLARGGTPAAQFAGPGADPEVALAGFRHVSELQRRGGSLKAEKEAAEAAFAEEPSEANWLRLRQLVEILEDGISSDPDLPDRAF